MIRPVKWFFWMGTALIGVLAMLCGGVLWSINTQAGTRWIAGIARAAMGEQLVLDAVSGTIAGPLSVRGLRYIDPTTGLQVAVRAIDIDLALRALLRGTVQVDTVRVAGVQVQLAENPPADDQPFSLDPPIDIVVQQLSVATVDVRRSGESLVVVTRADAAASWTDAGIAIGRLDVRSPQGELTLTGRVQHRGGVSGNGAGRFRWRAGELDYAGTLHADTQDRRNVVTLALSKPVSANFTATLTQRPTLAWRWVLDVPTFDPRESVLPTSAFAALSARLQGTGDTERNRLSGSIALDEQPLQLDVLEIARSARGFDIDGAVRLAQGTLNAKGTVVTAAEPVRAQFALDWAKLEIPAQWTGQVLHTQGHIDFEGSSERYAANGMLTLGPDERIANIALRIEGTGDAIQLRRFDIVQPHGKLASSGTVTLKPAIGWELTANADRFDPGAFAPAWNGSLSFGMKSAGNLTDRGPAATLVIDHLRGRLRNRALSGEADLSLQPGMLLTGAMDLRSGGSQLQLQGNSAGDSSNAQVDAVATAQIATLADWMPDASGALHARVSATGKWPQLRIAGNAQGTALQMAQTRAGSMALDFDIVDPRQPNGTAKLAIGEVAAAGFHFDSLHVAADGGLSEHRVTLTATGRPLATDLAVAGSLHDGAWTGTVQRLVLDLEQAARLALQSPAQVRYAGNAASVSQSCLADRDIRLCIAGDLAADGTLHADYSLQHVPLALANALAPGVLPVAIEGLLDGEGRIARSAQGTLSGAARIVSPAGQLSQSTAIENATPTRLLSYDDLTLIANLDGTTAEVKLNARLDRDGTLAGDVALTGLGTASPALEGRARATLPSIAIVEAFVPQLAHVQGKLELQASIAGTLDQPSFAGDLSLRQLAADVPDIGIQLRNGRFDVTPRDDGQFALTGAIDSGDGKLTFAGVAAPNGTVLLDIAGDRFLAADIPGARVSIAPDLDFARDAQRMSLSGKVLVPEATVNLQQLPRGASVQRASEDVVVIEVQTQETAAAKTLPLFAEVTVVLGDKVDLTGFGLAAKVSGQLLVKERPGEATTGSGEIRVAGTYKAYGQDLTIQQGQLLFAGTPLDNPRLSIVAVRTVDDVNAGLRVTGTAQNPQLTVFSDPPMGQANALSYLVAGKPLEEVGSGNAEGDALQTAARSLGTAAGGLLARKIGGRLGVDEVGIKDSDTLGGSALTVGQYLSPRLYLSYGVGLFQPGEVVTLRYKLKESLALQAERGPKDTRAGVEYRIEK